MLKAVEEIKKKMNIEMPMFQEFRGSSDGPIHLTFIVHLVLASWSMLGLWSGNTMLLHNLFFLICILWAIHDRTNLNPVVLAILIDAISIVLDIIVITVWYPNDKDELRGVRLRQNEKYFVNNSSEQFSAVMAIFNLIFRFASIYVLYQCWRERRDETTIYATTTAVPKVTNNTVRSPSRVSQRPIDTTNGYGYAPGPQPQPPKQELPPIPPSYSQHA